MSRKVFKLSNFGGADANPKQYVTTLDEDIINIFRWIQISRTRSIALKHNDFKLTNTDAATVGTTPTIDVTLLNATGDLASMYVHMPKDWDKDNDITIDLTWSLVSTEVNNDTLSLTCDYVAIKKETTGAGLGKTNTSITTTVDATTAFGLAVGDIYTSTFTLSRNDSNNGFIFADKTIGIAFEVHMTNVTEVASIHLVGGSLNYTSLY